MTKITNGRFDEKWFTNVEQTISIYEKKYPNDNRPRKAIEAAKKCINNPSIENIKLAKIAGDAAWEAGEDDEWDTLAVSEPTGPAAWAAWDVVERVQEIIDEVEL